MRAEPLFFLMAVNACAPLWLAQKPSHSGLRRGHFSENSSKTQKPWGRPVVEQADLGEQGVRLEQGLGSGAKT